MQSDNFLILDTEGKDILSELVLIDHHGELIYEGFVKGHLSNEGIRLNCKTLVEIIQDFLKVSDGKRLICHFAEHDIEILRNSFKIVGISWQARQMECTFLMAKAQFPKLRSYSLDYLSKYFNLQVKNKRFNDHYAHRARYDALFTYQLYRKLRESQTMAANTEEKVTQLNIQITEKIEKKLNPFVANRVDTPFQTHADLSEVYQDQFKRLHALLEDIKHDKNHQSIGAVVIGEPGSGKTHLIMRLAKEVLKHNRLLFIRQPTNAKSVLFHTYSRILESLMQEVPNTSFSQLDYLLARSFSHIFQISATAPRSRLATLIKPKNIKDEFILNIIQDDPLALFEKLGEEGSRKKLDYWQQIEKHVTEWWREKFGNLGGYAPLILKGLMKYCSYSDPHKRQTVRNWLSVYETESVELASIGLNLLGQEINKEDFALQAMGVFAKLSVMDEPLIIVFDQLEALGEKNNQDILLSFGSAVKEIFTHVQNSLIILNLYPERWEQFKQIFDGSIIDRVSQSEIALNKPSDDKIKKILLLRAQPQQIDISKIFTKDDLNKILAQDAIRSILKWASHYYQYRVEAVPLPESLRTPMDKVREEVEKLHRLIQQMGKRYVELQKRVEHLEKSGSSVNKPPVQKPTIPAPTPVESQPTTAFSEPPIQFESLSAEFDDTTENDNRVNSKEFHETIGYLEQQREVLEKNYDKLMIIDDADDIGKLIIILQNFKLIRVIELDHLRLGKSILPEHVLVNAMQPFVIGFLHVSSSSFTSRIKNFNELVINSKDIRFGLFRDTRQPAITGKVGSMEIEKLKNAPNGKFIDMDKGGRLSFELIYKLITEISNKDVDFDLKLALHTLEAHFKKSWLIQLLTRYTKLYPNT
jgi:DNA polymerase III epsilon subunit-like protein